MATVKVLHDALFRFSHTLSTASLL